MTLTSEYPSPKVGPVTNTFDSGPYFAAKEIEFNLWVVTMPAGTSLKAVKRGLIQHLWRKHPLWNIGVSNLRTLGYRKNGDGLYRHHIIEVVDK
jgi:hypothetical protein